MEPLERCSRGFLLHIKSVIITCSLCLYTKLNNQKRTVMEHFQILFYSRFAYHEQLIDGQSRFY